MILKTNVLAVWAVYLATIIVLTACGKSGSTIPQTEPDLYNLARQAYTEQRYNDAIQSFEQQLATFPNGNLADDAELYVGRSQYWLADYTLAEAKFKQIPIDYPTSDRLDAVQYWLAKTYHAQAVVDPITTPFDTARTAYMQVTGITYSDNAAFQIGKTYLDEAMIISKQDPALAMTALDQAVSLLSTMITDFTPVASTSIDDAQFYLARSYHEMGILVRKDANLSVTPEADIFNSAHSSYLAIASTSPFLDDAQYFDAQAFHDQADFVNARVGYGALVAAGTSNWADDAKYQIAKTYYDEGIKETVNDPQLGFDNFLLAIVEFSEFETNTIYALSSRRDAAAYFKARSYHRQADISANTTLTPPAGGTILTTAEYFQMARTAFQFLIDNFPTSGWIDNAQYQIGSTYYDESILAAAIADYVQMQQQLNDAILAFSKVTSDPALQLLNSADNAQYYLGRSYHRIADLDLLVFTDSLAIKQQITDSMGVLVTVDHTTARAAYSKVLTDPLFTKSTWKDNALYRIGKTYVTEANIELASATPVDLTVTTAYNNALDNFNTLITDPEYAETSRIDNAALAVGTIYQNTEYCVEELAWFDYLTNVLLSGLTPPIRANACDPANVIYTTITVLPVPAL